MDYNASSIKVVQNLAQIRRSPNLFIGSKDSAGQIHMIREIVDNSIDELVLRPDGGVVYILIFRDLAAGKYQIGILDGGRGIPSASVMDVHTLLGASGKADADSAYKSSGGQFGYGAKVAAALSKKFRVISKNYLESVYCSLTLNDSEVKEHITTDAKDATSGVLTVFEPDLQPHFFTDGPTFMTSGYLDLVNLCKQLNIFNEKINFQIYMYDRFVPNRFWTEEPEKAIGTIAQMIQNKNKEIVYDSSSVPDKSAGLFDLVWRVNSGRIFEEYINKEPKSSSDRLGFSIRWYFTQKAATGTPQYFVTVNNVSLPDKTDNSATVVFMNLVRKHLSVLQETPELKTFVANEYRFPTMLLALGIRYHNAALSGATKTSFKDLIFAKQFEKDLESYFQSVGGPRFWNNLNSIIQNDIVLRYKQFYDVPATRVKEKRIFTDLNYPKFYMEAKSGDRNECELYLVEGLSAGIIITSRDNNTQAIYQTKGKPLNAITTVADAAANRRALMANPIYQDIMRIINVTPNTTDMSNSRFSKIIIATDADADGYHIRALHLNNFFILNPRIIESGMVWLANPPLYGMEISKSRKVFVRNKAALTEARIDFLYRPSLDIAVRLPSGTKVVDGDLYKELCYITEHVGDEFARVARQLGIPLLILERLVFAAECIYPVIQYDKLSRWFDSNDPLNEVRVRIDEVSKMMVISIGKDDQVIGLHAIGEIIVNHLLPVCKKYRVRELMFEIRTKHTGSIWQTPQPASMMMLYAVMQELNKKFSVHRYKGLGQMSAADCAVTLMRPESRSITQITDIGQAEMNMQLLGKDSAERKRLLYDNGSLHTQFMKDVRPQI